MQLPSQDAGEDSESEDDKSESSDSETMTSNDISSYESPPRRERPASLVTNVLVQKRTRWKSIVGPRDSYRRTHRKTAADNVSNDGSTRRDLLAYCIRRAEFYLQEKIITVLDGNADMGEISAC